MNNQNETTQTLAKIQQNIETIRRRSIAQEDHLEESQFNGFVT